MIKSYKPTLPDMSASQARAKELRIVMARILSSASRSASVGRRRPTRSVTGGSHPALRHLYVSER